MDGQQQQEIAVERLERIKALSIWQGALAIRPLKGGISNESWLVSDDRATVVVRFGEDYPFHHVGRAHEAMVAQAAHEAGFAPRLIHAEPGMMISQFLNARTFDSQAVRANLAAVAALVRDFHQQMPDHVSGYARLFWVFHVLRDYARTLKAHKSRHAPRLDPLLGVSKELEAAQISLPLVYGHNDLLPANFLQSDGRLWLIDFEYAGFSTALFDLAGLSSNAGFDDAETTQLLALYFGHSPDQPLQKAMAAMQCASLLREAMWSMVSELFLNAPGVDYEAYTAAQLEAFAARLDAYQSSYGKLDPS